MADDMARTPWLIDIIKALVWPAVVLFVIISFWEPLQTAARLLPRILEDTETIVVGGVQLNVKRVIADRTPAKVRVFLPRLSPAGLQYILENGESGPTYSTSPTLGAGPLELISAGICTALSKEKIVAFSRQDSRENNKKIEYETGFECGDSYDDIRAFLISLVPELVRQAMGRTDNTKPSDNHGKK